MRTPQDESGPTGERRACCLCTCERVLRRAQAGASEARQRCLQLEAQLRARDKEVERLGRQVEAGKAELAVALTRVWQGEQATQKAEGAASSARGKLTHVRPLARLRFAWQAPFPALAVLALDQLCTASATIRVACAGGGQPPREGARGGAAQQAAGLLRGVSAFAGSVRAP